MSLMEKFERIVRNRKVVLEDMESSFPSSNKSSDIKGGDVISSRDDVRSVSSKSLNVAQLICNKHLAGYTVFEIAVDLELQDEFVKGVIEEAKEKGLYDRLASLQ